MWSDIPLGEIAPANGDPLPSDSQRVWNLSLEDIEPITGRVIEKRYNLVSELGSAKCCFNEQHVLYSKLRPYLNKVVVPDGAGVGTSELIPLRPDPKRLNRDFLAYYLRSPRFLAFTDSNTRGANLPRISMKEFWKHPIPVPDSVSKQQRIVARIKECLGKVDEVEALRNQAQNDSHQLVGAIFNDHLNEVAGSAPEGELGDVLVRAQYGTSNKANTNGQGVPVLRMGNIQDGYLDATNLKHIELPAADLAKYQLNVGDVLINRTNSLELVGKSGLFDGLGGGDWVFASYLVRLEIDTSKALPGYINAMINSKIGRNYVNRTARRAIGMVNINVKEMKKMRVLLPDLDVQQSVVDRLDSAKPVVDRLIDEQKGDEVSALRESILHQAFSGEL